MQGAEMHPVFIFCRIMSNLKIELCIDFDVEIWYAKFNMAYCIILSFCIQKLWIGDFAGFGKMVHIDGRKTKCARKKEVKQ